MARIEDGGPAFPVNDSTISGEPGMTLRDYFAAKAMQGFNACSEFIPRSYSEVARYAYDQADAMLAARTRKPE